MDNNCEDEDGSIEQPYENDESENPETPNLNNQDDNSVIEITAEQQLAESSQRNGDLSHRAEAQAGGENGHMGIDQGYLGGLEKKDYEMFRLYCGKLEALEQDFEEERKDYQGELMKVNAECLNLKNQIDELLNENEILAENQAQGQGQAGDGGNEISIKDHGYDDNLLIAIEMKVREEMEGIYEERLHEQISIVNERSKQEIEDFYEKVQAETEDLLLRKGITKERQRELEDEIREKVEKEVRAEFMTQNGQSGLMKSRNGNDQSQGSIIYQDYQGQGESQYNEFSRAGGMNLIEQQKIKDEIREELAKEYSRKDRLLQVNTKRKLETAKKTMKEGLEKELNEQLEAARQESQRERCEIARLKSVENIRLKKLKDLKRETDKELQKQRLNYEKVIQELRKQVHEIQMSQEPTTSERGHSNDVSGYTEEDGGNVYGSNIKDQMIKMNKGRIPLSEEHGNEAANSNTEADVCGEQYHGNFAKKNEDNLIYISNQDSRADNPGVLSAKEQARCFVDNLKGDGFQHMKNLNAKGATKGENVNKWKNRLGANGPRGQIEDRHGGSN